MDGGTWMESQILYIRLAMRQGPQMSSGQFVPEYSDDTGMGRMAEDLLCTSMDRGNTKAQLHLWS